MTPLEKFLLSVQKKSFNGGSGISLASAYIQSVIECNGFCSKTFGKLGQNTDLQAALKSGQSKFTWRDPKGEVTQISKKSRQGDILLSGKAARPNPNELSTASVMEFENILTTGQRDRDGDVLVPRGARVDPSAPLLWQHLPMEPLGKMIQVVDQTDEMVKTHCGIADTKMGRDAACLVEYGALRISHGFKPTKFEPLGDSERKGQVGDEEYEGWKVMEYEVMEVSLVSIPANTGAVITAYSRQKLHSPLIKSWARDLYEKRPALVTGGWQKAGKVEAHATAGGTQGITVNVNLNSGDVKTENDSKAAGCGTGKCGCGAKNKSTKVTDTNQSQIDPNTGSDTATEPRNVNCPMCSANFKVSKDHPNCPTCGADFFGAGHPGKGGRPSGVKSSGECAGCGMSFSDPANQDKTECAGCGMPFTDPANKAGNPDDDDAGDLDDDSELEDQAGVEDSEIEGMPPEEPETQEEEPKAAAINDIADSLKTLAKDKTLPGEAGSRLNVVSGLIGEVATAVNDTMKEIASAGKGLDIAGVASAVSAMQEQAQKRLQRAMDELGRVSEVEGIDPVKVEEIQTLASSLGTIVASLGGLGSKADGDDGYAVTDDGDIDTEPNTKGGRTECAGCGMSFSDPANQDKTECAGCGMPFSDPANKDGDGDLEVPEPDTQEEETKAVGQWQCSNCGNSWRGNADDSESGEWCPRCGSTNSIFVDFDGPGARPAKDNDDLDTQDDDTTDKASGWTCGCGAQNSGYDPRCHVCGMRNPDALQPSKDDDAPLDTDTGTGADSQVKCGSCQKSVPADMAFCGYCGASIVDTPETMGDDQKDIKGEVTITCNECWSSSKVDPNDPQFDDGLKCPKCGSTNVKDADATQKDGDPIDAENPEAILNPEDENPGVPDEKGVVEEWPGAGKNVVEENGQYFLVDRSTGERCSRLFSSLSELRRWASKIGYGS